MSELLRPEEVRETWKRADMWRPSTTARHLVWTDLQRLCRDYLTLYEKHSNVLDVQIKGLEEQVQILERELRGHRFWHGTNLP